MVETLPPNSEKQESAVPRTIGDEVDLFINQIDALADTLPLATMAIHGARTASRQQLSNFFKEECQVASTDGTKTNYNIDASLYTRFQRYKRRVDKAELAQQLVPRVLLVALVSQFDAFVGGFIRALFNAKPEMIDCSERIFSFSQLMEFGSIEAAREYVVEKEIESVLRNSHSEQFEWLENKFKLPLRKELPAFPVFIEATERRNLFVHTNGVVSRQYLEVCRKHGCQVANDVCLGKVLPVTREYFATAYECLFEIGVKLGQVLWRKVLPTDMNGADANLVIVTYNLISDGRYQLAPILLDFATETLKAHASEDYRLRLVVNRAQTYKWTGDEEKCQQILKSEDWTASSLKFKLAVAVLSNNFKEANETVKQIGKDDAEINRHNYREWPMFKELRKSPEFIALFEQIFGEPLNKFVVHDAGADSSTPQRVN